MSETAPDFDPAQLADLAALLPRQAVCALARSFRESICVLVGEIESAVGDLERLKEHAHDLKGTSGNFGAMRLSQLAAGVERICAAGAIGDLAPQLAQMQASAAAAFAALDAEIAKLG